MWGFCFFFIVVIAILVSMKLYFIMVLICISLVSEGKHLFRYLLTILYLWRNVYSDFLLIFKLGYLSFCCWIMDGTCSLSYVQLFATLWPIACQAPPSMGFSRQEYWSGLPFPSPGDIPNPGIEPGSPALQADSLPSEPPGKLLELWIVFIFEY